MAEDNDYSLTVAHCSPCMETVFNRGEWVRNDEHFEVKAGL